MFYSLLFRCYLYCYFSCFNWLFYYLLIYWRDYLVLILLLFWQYRRITDYIFND